MPVYIIYENEQIAALDKYIFLYNTIYSWTMSSNKGIILLVSLHHRYLAQQIQSLKKKEKSVPCALALGERVRERESCVNC